MTRRFFPLDEELGLLPGALTPHLHESAVRLGAWVPFPQATPLLHHFVHTGIAEATLRRTTERAGAAMVAVQTAAVARLEQEGPAAPAGPARQQLSADGAMVPLVGKGVWAEVKTLAIGTIQAPVLEDGQVVVHTTDLSYFSRLADHATFTRLALVETHRRGVTTAGVVAAINDGALWEQTLVDEHRPDAVRILDWGHAAAYLGAVARTCFGEGASAWLLLQLAELREGDPEIVLGKLCGLAEELTLQAGDPTSQAKLATVRTSLAYLEARREQIRYAAFRAAGYPIGSGSIESANKLVVEARLKGAGMHWAPEHVNPMLALRNIVCNDRWEEAWAQIGTELRQQQQERRRATRCRRRAQRTPSVAVAAASPEVVATPAAAPTTATSSTATAALPRRRQRRDQGRPTPPLAPASRRPSAQHPWRQYGQALNPARQRETADSVN